METTPEFWDAFLTRFWAIGALAIAVCMAGFLLFWFSGWLFTRGK